METVAEVVHYLMDKMENKHISCVQIMRGVKHSIFKHFQLVKSQLIILVQHSVRMVTSGSCLSCTFSSQVHLT